MVGIALDALLVFVLLKALTGKEIGFWTAALIGLCASTATTVLANKLISQIGYSGVFVAVPVAGALLGLVTVWAYHVKIKQACLIGTIFAVVHLAYVALVSWLLGRL